MKQQHLLFMAMAILVIYSLTFPQKELNQTTSSNDHIKIAKEKNNKHIAPSKVDEIKTQLIQTEYERTSSEITSKCFIQDEYDLIFSTFAFNTRIDFGMGPLQI